VPQLSRRKKFLISAGLLTLIVAAAGIYFIVDTAYRRAVEPEQANTEGRRRCTVPLIPNPTVWDTCTCAFTDVRKFEQPIIISEPTVWVCVDYAVTSINVTSSGSLTVTNSSLRYPTEDINANTSMWRGLSNRGQLRIYSSRIGLPIVVEPSAEAVFEARDSNLTETNALGGSTILKGVKPYFGTWGVDVRVSGSAQVTLADSDIDLLKIEPSTSFININDFNATSLATRATDYDFRTEWGMEQPRLRLTNTTAKSFELDIMAGRSASISNSEFNRISPEYFNLILIQGGSVNLVDSKLGTIWGIGYDSLQVREGGVLRVEHSDVSNLQIVDGDCTVSFSKVHGLELYAFEHETITINGFDDDRDGGNCNFTSWGFTHLHVRASSSNVEGVRLVSSGATVWIRTSKLGIGVSASGGYVYISNSQLGGGLSIDKNGFGEVYNSRLGSIVLDNGGYGEVSNSTVKYSAEADRGASVKFLNVTLPPAFVGSEDFIITEGGEMVVSYYVFVRVYDAQTRIPLSGVSLTARAATGNTTFFAVDRSSRIILVSWVRTGGSERAHEHGAATLYFPYNLTATRQGYLPSHKEITALWNNSAVEIYMQPETTILTTISRSPIATEGGVISQRVEISFVSASTSVQKTTQTSTQQKPKEDDFTRPPPR
jgi:hypothetical protein